MGRGLQARSREKRRKVWVGVLLLRGAKVVRMQRRCCGRRRKERRKGEGLAHARRKKEKERRKVEGFGQKRAGPRWRKRKRKLKGLVG